MKKILCIITVVHLIFLTSCTNKENNSLENTTDKGLQSSYIVDYEDGMTNFDVEEIKADEKIYEGKTKIVYLTNYNIIQGDNMIFDCEAIEAQVNKYLNDNGYDFYVDFLFNSEFDYQSEKINPNINVYEQMIADGKQVDIFNTGIGLKDFGGYSGTYNICIEKNYLEPLNEYFKTEAGKNFFNQYDKIFWAQAENKEGIIFGKPFVYSPAQPLTLTFNEENGRAYGLKNKNISDFSELESIFQNMASDGKRGLLIDPNNEKLYQLAEYAKWNGIYINVKNKRAENIFEDKNAIKLFNTIRKYYDKGYIETNVTEYSVNNMLCCVELASPMYNEIHSIISKGYLENSEINSAVGISSESKHKKEAFELLALINTDPELCNIIYNGIENRNYVIQNNKKVFNQSALPFYDVFTTMTNPVLADNNSEDNPNKKADVKKCNEASEISPFFYFETADDNLLNGIDSISEIYKEYYGLFYGKFENVEAVVKEANKKLYDAGLQEILDEANRQLEKYHNKSN